MAYSTLIDCTQLLALQDSAAAVVLLDCSFDLADPGAGQRAFDTGHPPGAHYAHLDRDFSGAKTGGNGRHPLPARVDFAATVAAWGITPGVQVVCFDGQGGPYAARAWWLLRWLGHAEVAVLDGGVQAWRAQGGVMVAAATAPSANAPYPDRESLMPTVDAGDLLATLGRRRIIDARAPERFRGEVEPLDAVAGHIPGASNRFFKDNLDVQGCFKPAAELRSVFEGFGTRAADIVHQCGSGVTACHNLLAMAHAGLEGSTLYPGSWSEWCSDPARPVAQG